MSFDLHIVNAIVSGSLPFKRTLKESEIKKLIQKSKNFWQLVNEEMSPILQLSIDKEEMTKSNKNKRAVASIWKNGKINIVGVISLDEASNLYDLALKDIQRFCGKVLE